ncbi:hypothetical protein ACJX0J_032731 [Zea mays]
MYVHDGHTTACASLDCCLLGSEDTLWFFAGGILCVFTFFIFLYIKNLQCHVNYSWQGVKNNDMMNIAEYYVSNENINEVGDDEVEEDRMMYICFQSALQNDALDHFQGITHNGKMHWHLQQFMHVSLQVGIYNYLLVASFMSNHVICSIIIHFILVAPTKNRVTAVQSKNLETFLATNLSKPFTMKTVKKYDVQDMTELPSLLPFLHIILPVKQKN